MKNIIVKSTFHSMQLANVIRQLLPCDVVLHNGHLVFLIAKEDEATLLRLLAGGLAGGVA